MAEDDRVWLTNWQAGEIRWLHTRIADLERQLRRKKIALTAALVSGGLVAATAAVFAGMAFYEPEAPLRVAQRQGDGTAAVVDGTSPSAGGGATGGGRQTTTGDPGAEAEPTALRAALTAARERIAELETAGGQHEATIAELRAELDTTRGETRALSERLEASLRGIARLNEVLTGATGRTAAEEGGEADRPGGAAPRAAAAPPTTARTGAAPPAPARVTTAGSPSIAEGAGGGAQTAATAHYAATTAVNVRAGPNTEAEVLGVLRRNEVVRAIRRDSGWVQVGYADPRGRNITGWVYETFLRGVEAPANNNGRGAPAAPAAGG